MALIKGIRVKLKLRLVAGTDSFGMPVYSYIISEVDNVLVTPLSSDEIAQDYAWYGRKTVYELCIPKTDNHDWANSIVEFFSREYETVGDVREYIAANVPGEWNRKIRVAAYE